MRARLARAAFEIIAERGISSLRTAAVVERIGVSQGALLHHFATKEDLTLAAIEYALSKEEARSLKAATDEIPLERGAMLTALIEDFRAFFFHDCFWATLDATMDSGRDKALQMRVTAAVAHYRAPIYAQWTEHLRCVGFSPSESQEIVTMTAALVSGFAMRSLWQDISATFAHSMATWSTMIDKRWPALE